MSFFKTLFGEVPAESTPKIKGVLRHTPVPTNVRVNNVRRVRPRTIPLTEQRGWKKSGRSVVGSYATPYGTFDGRIEIAGDRFELYVKEPPQAMRRHPKWACFHHKGGGWHWVHLHRKPHEKSADAGIRYMESLLAQALSAEKRRA